MWQPLSFNFCCMLKSRANYFSPVMLTIICILNLTPCVRALSCLYKVYTSPFYIYTYIYKYIIYIYIYIFSSFSRFLLPTDPRFFPLVCLNFPEIPLFPHDVLFSPYSYFLKPKYKSTYRLLVPYFHI